MEIFLFFLPSSLLKCNSFLDSLPLFFFISACLSFYLCLCFSWEPWLFEVHFHAESSGKVCMLWGDSGAGGCWGERGPPRGTQACSRRDRCFPGYSGNSSGVSSCFDSKTSVTSGCPVLCRHYYNTAFLSPNKLPFPSTHFPKPRMPPQTWSTDLLKSRLTFPEENFPSWWKAYFCRNHIPFFLKYKKRGTMTKIFFVTVLCSVTAIKSSENTISFEKKKPLKALLQTKLWK